jgi:FAD synthase
MIILSGKVIKGDGYGRKLGFPTANLDRRGYRKRKLKVRFGVYAGHAEVSSKKYKAGIVIGPLDKKGLPKIEAHLLEFKGNLYGMYIHLYIHKYIRSFRKFKTEQELIRQIKKDLNIIKSSKY